MRIILAPDSFKGNLTALQVASAFERGIKRVLPKSHCIKLPMADGGEGTVHSLVNAASGTFIRKRVTGPVGDPIFARYGILPTNETAVIEMAAASGLPLVTVKQRNPLKTTTYGTGELMLDAARRGVKKIIIGVGGSATNDGGVGMAQALGVRFLNKHGNQIKDFGSGGMLDQISSIDLNDLNSCLRKIKIIVASDVTNPLCGKTGAAYVFAAQKGATPEIIKCLDTNLRHLGRVIKRDLKKDVVNMKGAGAGGGISAGLVAFMKARIKSGIDIVLDETNIRQYLKTADLVITGEGRVDSQTIYGKTPAGVAKLARKYQVPTIVIGGTISSDSHIVFSHGISGLESAFIQDMPLQDAMKHSKTYLAHAAERVVRLLLIGKKIASKKSRRS